MRNLEDQLRRMAAKYLIKLVDSAYKVKQTVEQSITENAQTDYIEVNYSILTLHTTIVPEIQETPKLLSDLPQTPKRPAKNIGWFPTLFGIFSRKIMKEMEIIKNFTRVTESLKIFEEGFS